jgi:dihydrofolate synthase/folylpolyglutamate synthase
MGNPQNDFQTIHVGGTNGKGTVCKYISSILVESGYNVGLYNSPHLQHISERIIFNNKKITEEELILLVKKIKSIINKMPEYDKPTFFEIITAMAFKYFSQKKIDIAVVEVGLGGRYDATNVIKPILSIITNVTLEHENILGNNIRDIAYEKSGIINENKPFITAAKNDALKVIKNISYEKNAPIKIINSSKIKRVGKNIDGQKFLIKDLLGNYIVFTKQLGIQQIENIAITFEAIKILKQNGFLINDENLSEGIKKTENPGRMEIVSKNPIILLDGAHNSEGIKILANNIKSDFNYKKLIVIFGVLSDKNVKEMLDFLKPISDIFILTKSNNKRTLEPSHIKNYIDDYHNKKIIIEEDICNAINYSISIAEKNDLICVTGSLFLVGAARDCLNLK